MAAVGQNWDEQGKRGIQLLFDAEQEAAKIVEEAKQNRVTLLRTAKDEAEKEAREYRERLEAEYQSEVAKYSGSDSEHFSDLDKKREALLAKMQKDVAAHEAEVIDLLLQYAFKIE
ncbi:MAG: V-type H+-transporting ATPase subunit G [Streblomastix strix]|nr:MAG: V-type H+-transporting ATPase subunit G [Streblomastix strix]